MTGKSEVGEKLLDPDGAICSDIIRLGKELAHLKRQQEVSDPSFLQPSALLLPSRIFDDSFVGLDFTFINVHESASTKLFLSARCNQVDEEETIRQLCFVKSLIKCNYNRKVIKLSNHPPFPIQIQSRPFIKCLRIDKFQWFFWHWTSRLLSSCALTG